MYDNNGLCHRWVTSISDNDNELESGESPLEVVSSFVTILVSLGVTAVRLVGNVLVSVSVDILSVTLG